MGKAVERIFLPLIEANHSRAGGTSKPSAGKASSINLMLVSIKKSYSVQAAGK